MGNRPKHKKLSITNKVDELNLVANWLEELVEEWELPSSLLFSLNLVLEEALTNTILYGYQDNELHTIEIHFTKSEELLEILIIDDGVDYDPTEKMDPDVNLSAEERPIGGLGVYLIKKLMNTVEYQRIEYKNHLLVTKKIEP